VELEVLDPIAWRELRMLIRAVSGRDLQRIGPAEVGRIDSTVLGVRARVARAEARAGGGAGPQLHRLTVRVPGAAFPTLDERTLENVLEAEALVGYAREHPEDSYHAVSPFVAQALLIARLAGEQGVENLYVFTLERLGSTGVPGSTPLLVSTVVGAADPGYPYPMSDVGRVIELLGAGYEEVHVFSSPESIRDHPVLRRLQPPASVTH